MLVSKDKTAFIVAGPNGSGKTTFSISMIKSSELLTGVHLNADIIAKAYQLEQTIENHLKISTNLDEKIDELIADGQNIILETVFSSSYKLETFKKLKDNGYKINVVFVATDDPIKNVLYVTQRYLKNGHEVPISKIIKRYYGSISNIKKIVNDIDCLILIDNSIPNKAPKLYNALSLGNICYQEDGNIPNWINEILEYSKKELTDDEEKVNVCTQIQSVLDTDFTQLIKMDTDEMLELLNS